MAADNSADATGTRRRISRRQLFGATAVAGAGAAVAVGIDAAGAQDAPVPTPLNGVGTIPFYGPHQQGITTTPQATQNLVALKLLPSTTADDLRRMLVLLTDDAARMSQGRFALADSEAEFASVPANLTVTIGFGPKVVAIVRGAGAVPEWLAPLPAFNHEKLEEQWDGGDLLLQIATDDPVTLAHSTRMLLKDARAFAMVKWIQNGFRSAPGSQPAGTTMRNLLNQVDGTNNLEPGTAEFDQLVWRTDDWMAGGTTMVIRRIEFLLDKWDRLDRNGRDAVIGRRQDSGAPLTGTYEHDEPDFEATTPIGFPVIAEFAHIRRARAIEPHEKIFRRGYNYDLGGNAVQVSDSGLIFTSFQADLLRQFLPLQHRLDELDLLNEWVMPIGSAVFAIPPGTTDGGFIGEALFG